MRSVQEREQAGDAATESGFFAKGHAFAPDGFPSNVPGGASPGSGYPGGGFPGGGIGDGAVPSEELPAVAHGSRADSAHADSAHADSARADVPDPVLRAFGEVRGLNAELQRANDALHVVNEALRGKVDQLRATTLDLEQMLDGLETGILLLDEELAVRHFNDMAAHFLGLGPHDVGGSISASCRGFGPRLVEWCQEVLRSGRRIRRTFQSAIAEPLTLHIRRTRVDGEARLILVFSEAA